MVVACLAEVAQDMGAPIASYVDVIYPEILSTYSLLKISPSILQ